MLYNYLLLILRTLKKKKTYTAINLIGLSVGVSAFMIIVAYVSHSLSYDKFWNEHENIFRAPLLSKQGEEITENTATNFAALATAAKDELPEVKSVTRFAKLSHWNQKRLMLSAGEKENIDIDIDSFMGADSSFFNVFNCQFIRGSAIDYHDPGSWVLTASTADKVFGTGWRQTKRGSADDPIGKPIIFKAGSQALEQLNGNVTGIIEDLPGNTHLDISGIFYASFFTSDMATTWGVSGPLYYTYFKLGPETDILQFQEKLDALGKQYEKKVKDGFELSFPVQSISDIHLHSDLSFEMKATGNHEIVFSLSIIALLILLLAWLNYINLTVVQSMDQAREVGLRKVIGASRRELIQQFLLAALVLNVLSSALSFFLLHTSVSLVNQYLGTNIEFAVYYQGIAYPALFWGTFIAIYLAGTIISGIYPSIVLSAFKPTVALKGKVTTNVRVMGGQLRNGIIIFQFFITTLVLTGTLTVLQQTNYMQSQPLGFDTDKVLIIENTFHKDSIFNNGTKVLEDKLSSHSAFLQSSFSSSFPGHHHLSWHYAPLGTDDFRLYTLVSADYDFIDCYGIQILEGRYFDRSFAGDVRRVVINETAVKVLGYDAPEDALYTKIQDDVHPDNTYEIIGVIQDYHHKSLHTEMIPIIYQLPEAKWSTMIDGEKYTFGYGGKQFISIKIADNYALSDAMSVLHTTWNGIFDDTSMNYFFLDERYNAQYQEEMLFSKVFGLFSGLAVLIASLGLVGFITYSLRQRSKEIAVRKVLGANLSQLWFLLSKTYLKLIVLAMVIVIPIANYFALDWLNGFAYRIGLDHLWWIYLIPGILVLLIALLSISGQTVKAARTNPVESLKYE